MLCLCSKTDCCYDGTTNKDEFTGKGLNKGVLEQGSDGPLEKDRCVLDENMNIRSTNRSFRTNN